MDTVLNMAKNLFVGWASDKVQHITDEAFSSILDGIFGFYTIAIKIISNIIIAPFSPTYDGLIDNLFAFSTIKYETFVVFLTYTGYIIATLIFMLAIIRYFLSPIDDFQTKNTPITLLLRFILAVVLIYSGPTIVDTIMNSDNIGLNYVWNEALEQMGIAEEAFYESNLLNPVQTDVDQLIIGGLAFSIGGFTPIIALISIVIGLVFVFKVLKELIGLWFDMIMNYITLCFLFMSFGLGAAFISSKDTENTFSAYLKTLGCQIVLLFIQALCVQVALGIMIAPILPMENNGGPAVFLVRSIWFFSFCKFVRKFGDFLRAIGLSPSVNTSNALQSAGGGLGSLIRTIAGLDHLRQSAAGTLKAVGMNNMINSNGDKAKFDKGQSQYKAGSTLGLNPNQALSNLATGKTATGTSLVDQLASIGASGNKYSGSLSTSDAWGVMSAFLKDPTNNTLRDACKALPDDLMAQTVGKMSSVTDAGGHIDSVGLDNYGKGFNFTGEVGGQRISGYIGHGKTNNGWGIVDDGQVIANSSVKADGGAAGKRFNLTGADGNISNESMSLGLNLAGISSVSSPVADYLQSNNASAIQMNKDGSGGAVLSQNGAIMGTFSGNEFYKNNSFDEAEAAMIAGKGLENIKSSNDVINSMSDVWDDTIAERYGDDCNIQYSLGSGEGRYIATVHNANNEPVAELNIADAGRRLQRDIPDDGFYCNTQDDDGLNSSFVFTKVKSKD